MNCSKTFFSFIFIPELNWAEVTFTLLSLRKQQQQKYLNSFNYLSACAEGEEVPAHHAGGVVAGWGRGVGGWRGASTAEGKVRVDTLWHESEMHSDNKETRRLQLNRHKSSQASCRRNTLTPNVFFLKIYLKKSSRFFPINSIDQIQLSLAGKSFLKAAWYVDPLLSGFLILAWGNESHPPPRPQPTSSRCCRTSGSLPAWEAKKNLTFGF